MSSVVHKRDARMGHLGDVYASVTAHNLRHDYDASFKGEAEPDG